MRIAHLLSSFGMGGQERVALELATAQLAKGHDVLAISIAPPPDGPHADGFRKAGAEVFTIPKRPGVDPTLPIRLANLLRKKAIQVIHTHNPQPLIYGAPAGKLARAVVVHTKHGKNPDRSRRRWLRRAAATLADAYVAVSPTTAEVARTHHECAPDKLEIITNGIDTELFEPNAEARVQVRQELGIAPDAWVVGTLGRLAPEKDQALLIRAMGPLLGEQHHLVIVGDGPERESLEALADEQSGRSWIHLTGMRTDAPRLLSAFDVFALPSKTEGLPLVIPEAMAAGLPIVASAVGGIPDVIEVGVTGLLCEPEDEIALRRHLTTLAQDPQTSRAMGQRGQAVARERYSSARMADDYMNLYQEVMAA